MSSKLVGKNKDVFNSSVYFNSVRSAEDEERLSDTIVVERLESPHFNVPLVAQDSIQNIDKARIIIGSNIDFFDNELQRNVNPPKTFLGSKIELEYCEPPGVYEIDGDDLGIRQEVIFKTKINSAEGYNSGVNEAYNRWIAYMKTGITTPDGAYEPVIKADYNYYDLYHKSVLPFTPEESLTKQPAAGSKSFFADYSTYYNEMIDSINFENVLHNRVDIENTMPTPYGFVRIVNNQASKDIDFYTFIMEIFSLGYEDAQRYNNFFHKAPLEMLNSLLTYVFFMNPENFSAILNSESKNFNKNAIFEQYINNYAEVLIGQSEFAPTSGADQFDILKPINALERAMSRVSFSPGFTKLLKQVDKYKNDFPYYFNFKLSTEIVTEIGDLLRDLQLSRYFSRIMFLKSFTEHDQILRTTPIFNIDGKETFKEYGFVHGVVPGLNPWDSGQAQFYDYVTEKTYAITSQSDQMSTVEQVENTLALQPKDLADGLNMINQLIDSEISAHHDADSPDYIVGSESAARCDIRNNMIFVRDDFNEPLQLDEDKNFPYQKLAGAALKAKIIQKYKEVRRSYEDIINGVPAYTEDLFYKIVKYKRKGLQYVPIQHILFPNNSDVDVIEYVDTQLKYAKTDNDVYRYEVYVQRIVFGSKYKYLWGLNTEPLDVGINQTYEKFLVTPPNSEDDSSKEMINLESLGVFASSDAAAFSGLVLNVLAQVELSAKVVVEIQPAIKIVEDKIFTTPDILILDSPPVPPHVEVIPYRAVSDRLKFMLSGMSDRFREEPIVVLDTDQAEFDKHAAAQLSYDGKLEFGSDDAVQSFQIFRLKNKPKAYTDFELYQTVNENVFEEKLLPNTKYYYIFRAIDIRGHISNPTEVFEIELIDEKGAVKPNIKTYKLEPPNLQQSSKDFKKYLYIKPSIQQLFKPSDEDIKTIFSSQSKKKKYKIRLTSKSSGKKIDLNLSFERKEETN